MSGTDVREQLLQAALRVYAVAGVRGATTRRIAHEAGVNEVTLFRHFGSKDTLLQEALAWESRHVIEGVGLPAEPTDPAARTARVLPSTAQRAPGVAVPDPHEHGGVQ